MKCIKFVVLLGFVAGFSLCQAGVNVGFSTYARANIPPSCRANSGLPECQCVTLGDRFVSPSTDAAKSAVRTGDNFVVVLKTVWMGDFKPDGIFSSRSQYALVSRAFQYGDPKTQTGLDFSPESHKSGRVIYFSDDVRPGQFLNFGQIIIEGPATYLGNPVSISLFAIEVDSDAARTNSLISTLASIGSFAWPAGSPVLSVLESVGTALVRGNGDDMNLRYDTTVLDYRSLRPGLSSAFLAYGDYILFRNENRAVGFDYGSVHYRPSDGKLYGDATCKDEWRGRHRGDAYAVVQINQQLLSSSARNTQTYAELKKAIEAADSARADNVADVSRSIATAITADRTYNGILDAIKAVEPFMNDKTVPPSVVTDALKAKLGILEQVIASYDSPASSPKQAPRYSLTIPQIDILLGRLQSLAGARSAEISRSTFKADTAYNILEAIWAGK